MLKANLGTHTTVADRWALGPAHQCSVGPIGHASQIVPPTAAQGARNVGNWHPLLRSTFWNTCLPRSKKAIFCLLRSPEHFLSIFCCSGALFWPRLVPRSTLHRNKANFAFNTDSSPQHWQPGQCSGVSGGHGSGGSAARPGARLLVAFWHLGLGASPHPNSGATRVPSGA